MNDISGDGPVPREYRLDADQATYTEGFEAGKKQGYAQALEDAEARIEGLECPIDGPGADHAMQAGWLGAKKEILAALKETEEG